MRWAIGVDIGGTKIEVAHVDEKGRVGRLIHRSTPVKDGPAAVEAEILSAIKELRAHFKEPPIGIGVGMAGQIEAETGTVIFAPNLFWHNVPLQQDLKSALNLPVIVVDDVRAATLGEWTFGAGRGCDDLVCVFVGTGIGGGIVSGGSLLSGHSNTAGEVGHMRIAMGGPPCHCHGKGCLEAIAGGWAIAKRAQDAVKKNPKAGAYLLSKESQSLETISAKTVFQGFHHGDPLSKQIVSEVREALIAGGIILVNALNPQRLIFGGGIIEGLPELVKWIDAGIRQGALPAATASLQVVKAELDNAGVVGAGTFALLQD